MKGRTLVNGINGTNESPRHCYQWITNVAIDALGIILANDTIFTIATIVSVLHCRECHFREGEQNGRQQGAPMPNVTPLHIY